jgi:AraC-like DNA-binding protein
LQPAYFSHRFATLFGLPPVAWRNRRRVERSLPLLLGEAPFARFLAFSDWLYARTGVTGELALERLFEVMAHGLVECLGVAEATARAALRQDYARTGNQGVPRFLQGEPATAPSAVTARPRQARHQGPRPTR